MTMTHLLIFLNLTHPLQALAKPGSFLIETSPFKGLWGQTAFRAEHQVYKSVSVGYMAEKTDIIGENQEFKDQSIRLASEILWYLPSTTTPSFFVSLGISGERELLGRLAENPYHRFGSSSSQDKFTSWIQKNYYLSLHQSMGLRFYSTYFWTASLKLIADELITHSSTIEAVKGDLATVKENIKIRPLTQFNMLLHVGLWLP